MKKTLSMIAFLFITGTIAAQDSTKFFQRIKGGMIVGTSGVTTFSGDKKPFNLNYGLLAKVTFVTPKTYHNIMYNFGDNSICFLTGYLLPKKWDIYVVYSRGLNENKNYLAIALEKMIKAEDAECFLYSELGTDFQGGKILSVGILISIESVLWKRK